MAAAIAMALLVLTQLDWNRMKPWFDAHVSEALSRPFHVAGNLSLVWHTHIGGQALAETGWRSFIPWPQLVAQDITIGNPASFLLAAPADTRDAAPPPAKPPADMARIRQLSFSLDPFALLDHKIAIPLLQFDAPVIDLQRLADGRNNWSFQSDQHSPWQLELKRVALSKGSVHLVDAVKHIDATMSVDTQDGAEPYGAAWQVHGKYNGEALDGSGLAGAILSLQLQTTPYPLSAKLRIGATAIALEGTLTKPSDLAAIDMRLQLSSVSMADLYRLDGVVLPETPPFSTQGHLIGTLGSHQQHWIYRDFTGRVGKSDIDGSIDYRSALPRPLLSGTIRSTLLQVSDLAPLIGADSKRSRMARGETIVQPEGKALPVEPFKTERWHSIDADVTFSAEHIVREKELPINSLTTRLRLQDGVLSLSPLQFDMAGGHLRADITLDGSGKVDQHAIKAELKANARHMSLRQLFPSLQTLQASVGEINGDASLSAVGNSVASLLGASSGEVKALIDRGTISKLLLEEMGLNIGNVLVTRLIGDKQVTLNCMTADFKVDNGMMQARSFIVDTSDAQIDVGGQIDLQQEQLDLTMKANSKGLRVLSLRAPLYVRGSFLQPQVSADKGVMALRAGGAVTLALLSPAAALIPLVKTGGDQDGCAALLAAARTPPGKARPTANQTLPR